ncbi:MAG: OmpA family protein [Gammaproteobacteria bacterium]
MFPIRFIRFVMAGRKLNADPAVWKRRSAVSIPSKGRKASVLSRSRSGFTIIVAMILGAPMLASAKGVKLFEHGLTVDDWREELALEAPTTGLKLRSILLHGADQPMPPSSGNPAPTSASESQANPVQAKSQGIGVTIGFAYDSAEIKTEWLPTLDNLAQLLQEDPAITLIVEGHTDAVGGPAYNQQLSEKRASSVTSYLIQNHGIKTERLSVVGKGLSELLNPDDPQDSRNRRVQFVRVQ